MRKMFRLVALLVMTALVLAVVGGVVAQDGMKVLRTDIGPSDVPTLDPAIATDSNSIQILEETYVGLTMIDADASTKPGLAMDWTVTENADGTATYTFNLLHDIPWVRYNADSGAVEEMKDDSGNVRYVTAQDFVYGWKRTLDPATAGEYAYVLAPQVVGGTDFNGGTGTADSVMISAPDEYTVQVVAPAAYAYTPSIYGLWMARPQPQWVIDEYAEFWTDPANFVSFGPYALLQWTHGESISLIKNPFWPGTSAIPQAKIDQIDFAMIDETVALQQYEAGQLDRTDTVAQSEIPRIKADPTLSQEYFEGPQSCTYYAGFGVNVPPMDNVHLRRAFSYAVDRQDIVDNVTQGGQKPAPFFSNPALNASPLVDNFPDLGMHYDPDKAQEELQLALQDMGLTDVSQLPPITYLFNTSSAHQKIAEALQAMWEDTLGIHVELTNQEFATYLDQRKDFPVWRAGWCQDYPDDNNFLFDVFHSSSQNNDTGWSSPEFDALVEEAAKESDNQKRIDLYAQAEDILVTQDAAIIPIYFYSSNEMTKPYVERTYGITGQQRFEQWDMSN